MSQKILPTSHFVPLDAEEAELIEFIENSNITPVRNTSEIQKMKQAFENTKKRRHISLRIPEYDLEQIQIKAKRQGIPYQTLLGAIIHKVASSNIEIEMK